MFVLMSSRSSSKLGHLVSKTRSPGQISGKLCYNHFELWSECLLWSLLDQALKVLCCSGERYRAIMALLFFSCDTMTRIACCCNFSYCIIPNVLNRCFLWSEEVHMLLGLSFHHFYQLFPLFRRYYSGLISIRMIPCGRNSSYSFPPIIFKLSVLVLYGLTMCVWFWDCPPSIFYQLFQVFLT